MASNGSIDQKVFSVMRRICGPHERRQTHHGDRFATRLSPFCKPDALLRGSFCIVPTRLWFDWCFAFHHIATESGTHSGAIVLAHQSVLQVFFRGFLSDSIAFSINQGFTRYNRVFLGLPEIYSGQNYSEVFFCLLARATCFRCF